MPVSWHSRLSVFSATAMFFTITPSTDCAVLSVSRATSASNPRLMSGGSIFSARMYKSFAAFSTRAGSMRSVMSLSSGQREQQRVRHGRGASQRDRGFLPVGAPADELDKQQSYASGEMRREREHEERLDKFDRRLARPFKKPVKRRRPRQRLRQREEVQGQEQRQDNARNAMHDERPERRVGPGTRVVAQDRRRYWRWGRHLRQSTNARRKGRRPAARVQPTPARCRLRARGAQAIRRRSRAARAARESRLR